MSRHFRVPVSIYPPVKSFALQIGERSGDDWFQTGEVIQSTFGRMQVLGYRQRLPSNAGTI